MCINRTPDLEAIFRLIEDEKCTHLNLVPTIYGWMVNHPSVDQYDLSSVRLFTYAGSPFPVEILKQCIRKFGNRFAQGYGDTETAGAGIRHRTEDPVIGAAAAEMARQGRADLLA